MANRAIRRLVAVGISWMSVASIPLESFADSLSLTTWYPAPYGVYSQLRSTGNSYFAYQGGSVGIGTNSPMAKLHIDADPGGGPMMILRKKTSLTSDRLWIDFRNSTQDMGYIGYAGNDNNIFVSNLMPGGLVRIQGAGAVTLVDDGLGNVGIGTTNPNSKLEIQAGDSGGFWAPGKALRVDVPQGRGVVDFEWGGGESGAPIKGITRFSSGGGGGAGASYDFIWLLSDPSGNVVPQMRLVGQTGQLILKAGLVQNGSPDIAENIKTSTSSIEAGDLVEPDPDYKSDPADTIYEQTSVIKTRGPYAEALLGAIASDPGIVLNAGQKITGDNLPPRPGSRPVALAGRIPVKVCAQNGDIRVGDWITSSSNPGVGMKAVRSGRVLGIALQAFRPEKNGEVRKILVFLNPTFYIPRDGEVK